MNPTPPSRSGCAPLSVFILLFSFVFIAVVVTATLITFILPESFASTTRVLIQRTGTNSTATPNAQFPPDSYDPYLIQTEFEIIQSEVVLGKVIEELDLNTLWGNKFANGQKLKTVESLGLLKSRLALRPVRNTSIIEIQVFSEDRMEAATLANTIAQSYAEYARSAAHAVQVEIIDRAAPGARPIRPNKPLNIALGLVVGLVLGAVVGGAGAALTHTYRWKNQRPPPIP